MGGASKRSSGPRRYWRRLGAHVSAALFLASLAAPALAGDPVTVSQRNRKFSPDMVQVAPGTVVQIVNDDRVTHHIFVDSPGLKFDSGEQPIGKTIELKFDQPGIYDVYCAIHPTMHLTVTVK